MITITRTTFNRHGLPVTRTETYTDLEHALLEAELYAGAGWLVSTHYA